MTGTPRDDNSLTHGAAPQHKTLGTDEIKEGAQPTTTQAKPDKPPSGPSGVSPSTDGKR